MGGESNLEYWVASVPIVGGNIGVGVNVRVFVTVVLNYFAHLESHVLFFK